MTIHTTESPLAGKSVQIETGVLSGHTLHVEDWWDRVAGKSWMHCDGNPACLAFAMREPTPLDNDVLYGKIGNAGTLVHVSMLAAEETL